jgi:hypothetical protein
VNGSVREICTKVWQQILNGELHLEKLLFRLAENTKVWTEFMCFRTDSTDYLL